MEEKEFKKETRKEARVREKKEKKEESYYDQMPRFKENGSSKLWRQFNNGITYFLVAAAAIAFYFLFYRLGAIFSGLKTAFQALKPIVYGMAIAYILTPLVNALNDKISELLLKKIKKEKTAESLSRGISIFIAIVLLLAVVILLINMVIPQLVFNVRRLAYTLPNQLTQLVDKINHMELDGQTAAIVKNAMDQGVTALRSWLNSSVLPRANDIMTQITMGLINVVKEIFYMIIGLIISVYLLFSKEKFVAQAKKGTYALLSIDRANTVIHIMHKGNEIFSGFIAGKILDSAIIGVLCFVGLRLINIWYTMPYIVLVSAVVGVTNVIPFFGPYLGAIPCFLLIALNNPIQGIVFLLFILVLQQVDGNIIGPKILGDSTGLSAFWVIFAILLGGGLFGIPGMILGVPTFALIYYVAQMIINRRLERKKLPIQTAYYDPDSYVDGEGQFFYSQDAREAEMEVVERELREELEEEQEEKGE